MDARLKDGLPEDRDETPGFPLHIWRGKRVAGSQRSSRVSAIFGLGRLPRPQIGWPRCGPGCVISAISTARTMSSSFDGQNGLSSWLNLLANWPP